VDAGDAAEAAIQELDKNADGKLAKDEWTASPALVVSIEQYDNNGDSILDADEIENGIEAWQQTGVGARPLPFKVLLNGRPLAGAIVRIEPVSFLRDAVKIATGQTSPGGGGHLSLAPEDMPENAPNMPLVQPGLYRVEITHPSIRIPPKYNTETTLGIEITSGKPGPEGAVWSLSTK
jgi:hypothetical protein